MLSDPVGAISASGCRGEVGVKRESGECTTDLWVFWAYEIAGDFWSRITCNDLLFSACQAVTLRCQFAIRPWITSCGFAAAVVRDGGFWSADGASSPAMNIAGARCANNSGGYEFMVSKTKGKYRPYRKILLSVSA